MLAFLLFYCSHTSLAARAAREFQISGDDDGLNAMPALTRRSQPSIQAVRRVHHGWPHVLRTDGLARIILEDALHKMRIPAGAPLAWSDHALSQH